MQPVSNPGWSNGLQVLKGSVISCNLPSKSGPIHLAKLGSRLTTTNPALKIVLPDMTAAVNVSINGYKIKVPNCFPAARLIVSCKTQDDGTLEVRIRQQAGNQQNAYQRLTLKPLSQDQTEEIVLTQDESATKTTKSPDNYLLKKALKQPESLLEPVVQFSESQPQPEPVSPLFHLIGWEINAEAAKLDAEEGRIKKQLTETNDEALKKQIEKQTEALKKQIEARKNALGQQAVQLENAIQALVKKMQAEQAQLKQPEQAQLTQPEQAQPEQAQSKQSEQTQSKQAGVDITLTEAN